MRSVYVKELLGFAIAVIVLGASGCAVEESPVRDEGEVTTPARPRLSFDEFKGSLERDGADGAWIFEGDVALHSEQEVRHLYEKLYPVDGALTVNLNGGADDIWSRADRLNLTYCVANTPFGTTSYATMVDYMRQAAAAWENVANVRFVHDSSKDNNCTKSTTSVKFNVRPISSASESIPGCGSGFGACSFYPSQARSSRELVVNANGFSNRTQLIGVLMHELGHSLGFRHEQERVDSSCNIKSISGERGVTDYDSRSVMHYMPPTDSPCGTNNTGEYFISQRDIEGAQALYEAPTNVLNTAGGTLYARKNSTGDIYQKSGSSWVKIGGPGQAFVTVGNTLYGQGAASGIVVKYSGSGQSWVQIGAVASQIFNCGGALCATAANGNINKYSGSGTTWTNIGGPGAKFVGGGTSLWALSNLQDSTVKYGGSGAMWFLIGGEHADLIATDTQVFGLTRDRLTLEVYSGSGTSWSMAGTAGRQFHASGALLVATTPDGGSVAKRNSGTSWTGIGGAAARLYGSNGVLYATNPTTNDIYRYSSGTTWILEGQP